MSDWEIWAEGYAVTGMQSKAMCFGTWEGKTFKDAVTKWRDSLEDEYSRSCVDVNNLRFWGCKLYDNEKEARVNFG